MSYRQNPYLPNGCSSNDSGAPWNWPDLEPEDRICEICDEVLATDERTICTACDEICKADERAHAAEEVKLYGNEHQHAA